jgi:hypothetical protein
MIHLTFCSPTSFPTCAQKTKKRDRQQAYKPIGG